MIKTHIYVLMGIGIVAALITSIAVYILMPRGEPLKLQKPEILIESLKNGDIICRLGDRFWSQYFRDISAEDRRFSHMGIIRIHDDQVTVIHAEGTTQSGKDFVKEEPIDSFLSKARAIGIYRGQDADGDHIAHVAMEYLGLPFDWQFDMTDNSRIYCTELLYVVLKQAMPEVELNTVYIKEMGKDIIPLDSISKSEYFTEIFFQ